jgi:ribosomal protein S18 acetylase RimI-like enzyme
MSAPYRVRAALREDIDTLVAFTLAEAREAEGAALDPARARRGVEGAFDDPPLARYWVAMAADGGVVASSSVVAEWSNFHGGFYWWIQSFFIQPAHRGRGVAELLLDHLRSAAQAAGALELRLYAHASNERALRVYRRYGFEVASYTIMSRSLRDEAAPSGTLDAVDH